MLRLMKVISQHPFAAQELRGHACMSSLARSRSRALHCCKSLSLSCLCLMASRREARLLRGAVAAAADLEPNNSDSSCLASSRRSFERYVTLTQDSSQRSSPSESAPSHSTSTSSGRPRRPSKRRTAMIRRTAHFPPSSASCPAITGPMATRRRMSRLLCSTTCRRLFARCAQNLSHQGPG